MSSEQDRYDPADELELELRQMLAQFRDSPIPDELQDLAKKLESALKKRDQHRDPE